ncbi:hypothetical protein FIV02_16060 [Pseudomonas sp. THAF187a]|nr:hypothetical protein FIV02_16060 [Pseudomonas sp. THAF187a]QFT43272.1 hypothetical protein FIU98_16040 [Pseudomonas sp. THAF42]
MRSHISVITLGHNLASAEEVDALMAQARRS